MAFVIIMRHGQASNQSDIDRNRELTNLGRKDVHSVAEQLSSSHCQRVRHVLVSPYLRALQTWSELKRYFPNVQQVEQSKDVEPFGQVDLVFDYLGVLLAEHHSVLVVTHQPFIGLLGCTLCPQSAVHEFTPASLAVFQKQKDDYQLSQFIFPRQDANSFGCETDQNCS